MLQGENINEYYVRFHKLVNDIRNIKMKMSNIQLNSKFVNNMSPEWDRFVTAVKLNKGLKETNHEQLYTYLKQHEKHATQDRLIIERITPTTIDQLAFVSSVQPYTQSSPAQSHQYPPSSTPLLSPHVQSLPQTTNFKPLLTLETKQPFRMVGSWFRMFRGDRIRLRETLLGEMVQLAMGEHKLELGMSMQVKGNQSSVLTNGTVLDEEELFFLTGEETNNFDVDDHPVRDLALNDDNIFKADEYNAFDSDGDDEPTAQSIFMANLSSARPTNQQAGPSNASILFEVHDLENVIDLDHMGNSNVTPYEQYLSVNDVSVIPSCASSVSDDAYVLHDNDAYVPHDPLVTKLNIYKEQVAIYEQRARFELTLREQKMDEQISILIRDHNQKEENIKKELQSAQRAQPTLYDGNELLKMHHVPVLVPSSEEDLELAETTRIKINEKMNDHDVFFTVTDSAMTASRFHELSTAYTVAMNRDVELEAENYKLLEKIKNDDHDLMV
nr:integrase, catalytic region, zinc finger, CCHC-type, peptidase aspartic, catalytic [Tanacetum cinerariifolium]